MCHLFTNHYLNTTKLFNLWEKMVQNLSQIRNLSGRLYIYILHFLKEMCARLGPQVREFQNLAPPWISFTRCPWTCKYTYLTQERFLCPTSWKEIIPQRSLWRRGERGNLTTIPVDRELCSLRCLYGLMQIHLPPSPRLVNTCLSMQNWYRPKNVTHNYRASVYIWTRSHLYIR